MRRRATAGILMAGLLATGAFAAMRSPAALKAQDDYRRALRDAKKQYAEALKAARDAAMEKKDLPEANAIDGELQRVSNLPNLNDADAPPTATSRDIINVTVDYHTSPDATLRFNPDGTITCSRSDYEGERFWQMDGAVLRLFGPAKADLASEYKQVRVGDRIYWLGKMSSNGAPRALIQQTR